MSRLENFPSVDAAYVLSVKSFSDRIAHIQKEFAKYTIPFEFIFDYDANELDEAMLDRCFDSTTQTGSRLTNAHKSLVLKHIAAWKKAVEKNQKTILVFEDDVFFHVDFHQKFQEVLEAVKKITPGYLIFLGGENTRIPKALLLEKNVIFKNPIATAEGYLTDLTAAQKRMDWLSTHLVDLPADHLLKLIDETVGIEHYWSTTPLVKQGSVFGVFTSKLDSKRQNRSAFYNKYLYAWTILYRKQIPRVFLRCREKILKLLS